MPPFKYVDSPLRGLAPAQENVFAPEQPQQGGQQESQFDPETVMSIMEMFQGGEAAMAGPEAPAGSTVSGGVTTVPTATVGGTAGNLAGSNVAAMAGPAAPAGSTVAGGVTTVPVAGGTVAGGGAATTGGAAAGGGAGGSGAGGGAAAGGVWALIAAAIVANEYNAYKTGDRPQSAKGYAKNFLLAEGLKHDLESNSRFAKYTGGEDSLLTKSVSAGASPAYVDPRKQFSALKGLGSSVMEKLF